MRTQDMWVPRAENRSTWMAVCDAAKDEILQSAEAAMEAGFPMLLASQYMAYVRSGNREAFEKPYFLRRNRLLALALAECLTHAARFADAVTDGIWCLLEESTWCVSAHNTSGKPLADTVNPTVDLFAAQTAALLSWCCYLLEDTLPEQVAQRVAHEARARVLLPFVRRNDFWWMGAQRKDLNNWTPWILSNVLACAHIWGLDVDARAAMMLDRWLACVPPDGGLDEGAAYWNMAGGSLLDCLDHLQTGRYGESKIRNLAAFPLHAHIGGPYFLNFADCDAKPHLDAERLYTFGKRTGNPGLSALGAEMAAADARVLPRDTPEMYRVLCRLFHHVPAPSSPPPAEDITLPDLQVWVRRRGGVYFALKGGHNGEQHNHNDTGSFVAYVDGEPAIVDAGNMVYTALTFQDATRYTLWNTRSANHNVPMIGSFEQAAGRRHGARDVRFMPEEASMDIAGAYPDEAGVLALRRMVFCVKGGVFALTDEISLKNPLPVSWTFLLREKPAVGQNKLRAGKLTLTWQEGLTAVCAEYSVLDPRMAKSFPGTLYRLSLTAPPLKKQAKTFIIMRCMP